MGKTKITVIDDTPQPKEEEKKKPKKKQALKKEKGVRVPGLKGGERVVAVGGDVPAPQEKPEKKEEKEKPEKKTPKVGKKRQRSKNYLAARSRIEPEKTYSPLEAARLAKATSLSRFNGSIELHLVFNKDNISVQADLPHSTGKTKRVEIAEEETIKKLKTGKTPFDVLLATPEFMPKLVPFAKVLGPRGLMPNPKTGTVVKDPKKALKKFSGNALQIKTEKSAPLAHMVIAKADQPEKQISENLEAVFDAVGKKNIRKAVISASMGPAIRVTVS